MGQESVARNDLKWYALAPGPGGQARFEYPTAWDFEDPQAYFQQVVLPRKRRRLERAMWTLARRPPARNPKVGGEDGEGQHQQQQQQQQQQQREEPGESEHAGGKAPGGQGPKPKASPPARPTGRA